MNQNNILKDLSTAIISKNLHTVESIVKQIKNTSISNGYGVLHLAINVYEQPEYLSTLLSNIQFNSDDIMRAMFYAVKNNDATMLELLTKYNSNVINNIYRCESLMSTAVIYRATECMILLVDNGADISFKVNSIAPLELAVWFSYDKGIELLLNAGANITINTTYMGDAVIRNYAIHLFRKYTRSRVPACIVDDIRQVRIM